MALDPSDPPWVKFQWAAQLSELPPRQVAWRIGVRVEELLPLYAGKRIPEADTRKRIKQFAGVFGIAIPELEWLSVRQEILDALAPPTPRPAPKVRKPQQPKRTP